ncbi:hypothetical protein [Frigoriglobus tundricola]|uniref:PEP-CTERM protein-sorting domain-containing protein n=1 Tax=Frigoriglobus tundricola TaxID=2774151 RepID=A0A6M5YJL5_9BACT|nr:hypothetical protein [Frigoriglobus tundricola]QJW93501.1 hypothetical protein FTUN_1007 [Frigoriglobus tundricola]
MIRMAFAVVAVVGLCGTSARADTLPMFEGVPGTYTPGQTFTFQVTVPQLFDLNKYVVELDFGTNTPNPPLFVYSTAASTATGQYVFPSNANYQSTSTLVLDSPVVALTFSDSTTPPINTVPGANDTIATVTVIPGADLTGPITISIGGATLFNYDTENGQVPPPNPIVVQQSGSGGTGNPVPAPSGAVLLGIGGLLFGVRSRYRKVAVMNS